MKTLRQLSKYSFLKSLIIFFIFFSSVIAEDEPIDIWKIEKQEKINDNKNEIEDVSDTESNLKIINTSDQYTQIISNTSLEDRDLIVGLYDPSDEGADFDADGQCDVGDVDMQLHENANLIICLEAQGLKLPSPAEYKAAVPTKDNKTITNIKSKLIFLILFKFIKF